MFESFVFMGMILLFTGLAVLSSLTWEDLERVYAQYKAWRLATRPKGAHYK